MKKLPILLVFCLLVQITFAQTFTQKLAGIKKVHFIVAGNELDIQATSGGELTIETKDYEKPSKRADGLKPVYNTNIDNTGVGLSVRKEDGGVLYVSVASAKKDTDYIIKMPKGIAIVIEQVVWRGGDFRLEGLENEIEIKSKNSDIRIINITGPVIAHTTSGDIEVTYTKLSDKPNSISSTSGFVDVTLPKNVKANMIMSSVSGEIYTDFDLVTESTDSKSHKDDDCKNCEDHDHDRWKGFFHGNGRNQTVGKINGGGTEIRLKAVSGNVYLRKTK
ncbi:MAG: lia operon protein LiaG [Arenicella sp.]|jgi:hypothetical protein